MSQTVGRKTKYPEKALGSYPPGTFARIDRVLGETEDRTDFFREAAEREMKRREKRPKQGPEE